MTHLQQSEATPSVSYFPEGDQTFWSSHFPVAAKYGGFVMARKAAVKLKEVGRSVYLISVYMDFWDQMTTSKSELRIQAAAPVLVPSHPMSKRDEWVESQKIKFENNVNKTRGTHQVDLKKPQKVQGVWQSNRTCKDLFIEP